MTSNGKPFVSTIMDSKLDWETMRQVVSRDEIDTPIRSRTMRVSVRGKRISGDFRSNGDDMID